LIPTFIKYREVATAEGYAGRKTREEGRMKKMRQEAARLNWTKTRLLTKYPTVLSYYLGADCDLLQIP
jgi:aminoglycoside phosphotransferase